MMKIQIAAHIILFAAILCGVSRITSAQELKNTSFDDASLLTVE